MKRNLTALCFCFLTVCGMTGAIVHNPMNPVHPLVVGLEKVRSFSPENPQKGIFLTVPLSAVEGVDGEVYVVDGQSGLVHRYDSTGRYLSHFCGKGQGPGQINFPVDFFINSDGQVLIFDPFSMRVVIFSPKGILWKNVRLGKKVLYGGGLLQVSGGWVISIPKHDKKGQYQRDVIVLLDKAFTEIRDICPVSRWEKVDAAPVNSDIAQTRFTAQGDRIFVAEGSRTDIRIRVLNLQGKEIFTISRDFRPVARTADEIKHLIDIGKSRKAVYPKVTLVPPSPSRVSVADMFVDGSGRLWVKTARENRDKESKWDYSIFDKTGTLIGRIPALKGKVTVRGNHLCQLYEDKKTDEFRVAIYKIVEKNGGGR